MDAPKTPPPKGRAARLVYDEKLGGSPSQGRLIVFARFPEAGRAKTRLIPALGPERAAALHEALVRRTLSVAREFQAVYRAGVEARFCGGDRCGTPSLFDGAGVRCRLQQGADLGERLESAVSIAFQERARHVVVIGTDCPDLDPQTLASAGRALNRFDVVLGPATDGGYYLVGLRGPQSTLFHQIDWGTERVLQQTLERCAEAGLSVHLLHPLSDVDHPEDLVICRRISKGFLGVLPATASGLISIVMPVLDEKQRLEQTLRPLLGRDGVEVIVADGGSTDGTATLAREMGANVVQCRPGRGRQLNAGAAIARGEVLLFLHSDTWLPDRFEEHVWSILERGAIAGAFLLRIEGNNAGLRLVAWGANLRSRLLQSPYGDQGLFLYADDFFLMNGFRHWPLMEDYEFCRRLRKRGAICLAPVAATTSARRWRQMGILRTTLTNQLCIAAFQCGVSPATIARYYHRKARSGMRASSEV